MKQKWTYGLWGAAAGAVALGIVGFSWGGWQTASSANLIAKELSDKYVIAALAPFCVDRFLKAADATQSAELLKLATNYERGSFLEKGGWTSLPGSKETNWGVGRACGDLLVGRCQEVSSLSDLVARALLVFQKTKCK